VGSSLWWGGLGPSPLAPPKSGAVMLILFLLVRSTYIWVLFFTHIPFAVNRTFNVTLTERLQHLEKVGLDFFK